LFKAAERLLKIGWLCKVKFLASGADAKRQSGDFFLM